MKVTTGISIDDKILEQAKQAASQEGRPLSNYIEYLIRRELVSKAVDGGMKAAKK